MGRRCRTGGERVSLTEVETEGVVENPLSGGY